MQIDETKARILQIVEQNGVYVEKEVYGNSVTGIDMVFPLVMVLLCLSGTAHNDLQLRQQMLLSHLAVGFEFVICQVDGL
jgi:hypothetical protein